MLLIIVFVLSTRAGPGILKKCGAMFGAGADKKKELGPVPGQIKSNEPGPGLGAARAGLIK